MSEGEEEEGRVMSRKGVSDTLCPTYVCSGRNMVGRDVVGLRNCMKLLENACIK